jgi:hypothetical protein
LYPTVSYHSPSINIQNINEVYDLVGDAQVVGIDEAQFLVTTLLRFAQLSPTVAKGL